MMLGHSIYARRSQPNPALKRIGSCTGYQTIRSARSLLAKCAVKCSEDEEPPMPSTFTRDENSRMRLCGSLLERRRCNIIIIMITLWQVWTTQTTQTNHHSPVHEVHTMTLCSAGSFSTFSRCYVEHATSKTASVKYRIIGLNHTNPIMGRKSPCQEVHRHAKPVLRLNLPADRHLTTHTLKTYMLRGAQGTTLPRRVLLL